jgi:hypothetical protein
MLAMHMHAPQTAKPHTAELQAIKQYTTASHNMQAALL